MKNLQLSIDGLTASGAIWQHDSSTATPLHFAHGNGFPALCYQQMLEPLAEQRTVFAIDHRAVWAGAPPANHFSWADAADDMIAGIEQVAPNGVIGVGHSLGGVMTLLAAHKRPDLFKKIILIEPVMFPMRMFVAMGWMPMDWRLKYFPIAKRTMARQDVWHSHADFVAYHARKAAFVGIAPAAMADYAAHGLRPRGEQFELAFPKHWEAHIFRSAAYPWRALAGLTVPCVCIRAEKSHWIPKVSWQKWRKMRPDYPLHVVPDLGHMAPLQEPLLMAQKIESLMND